MSRGQKTQTYAHFPIAGDLQVVKLDLSTETCGRSPEPHTCLPTIPQSRRMSGHA